MHSLDRDRIFCHSDYSVETIKDLSFSFHIQTTMLRTEVGGDFNIHETKYFKVAIFCQK